MHATPLAIPEVMVIEPQLFGDARGFFFESFNAAHFAKATGQAVAFVQDNHSRSQKNVLRGLHYQIRQPQGKLVRVVAGEIFDVAVDIRRSSPTFGRWVGEVLNAENKRQLWIPVGFAHGFVARVDGTEVLYKTTDYWAAEHERSIRFDDPALGIEWGVVGDAILSAKDQAASLLADAELFS